MAVSHADAWMPLYIGDYLRDTTRLTRDQHGAYLLLIMDYWVNGPPPDDNQQLALVTRSTPSEWRKLKPVIAQFFSVEGGLWRHKRIDAELERTLAVNEQRRDAGKASAEARRLRKISETSTPVATSVPTNDQRTLARADQRNSRPLQPPSSLRSESTATLSSNINGHAKPPPAEPDDTLPIVRSFHALKDEIWGITAPTDEKLTPKEISVVRAWVEDGVEYYPALDFMTKRMERMRDKGEQPPERPQFFDRQIREARQAGWPGFKG